MIVKYISELLYDRECVIVPEFGAFISKEAPAMIDYVNHRLTPPSKEVVFNGQLVADDSVLVDYVSVRMHISHDEAVKMVHDFAMQSLAVLEADEPLNLEGLGTLRRINSKDFSLELDKNANFLGDAYGLTTFTVQPIYRSETYQHIATKIATEQKMKQTIMTVHEEKAVDKPHRVNRHNYRWFRAAAYSMVVATALVLLGWGANVSDSKLASWIPFFYSSPNEFIANRLTDEIANREMTIVEPLQALNVTVPIVEKEEINYIEPLDNELLKPIDDRWYYIIGASLGNTDEAKRCVKRFVKQGFEGAVALPANKNGNIRVAYEIVFGKDAATQRLDIIRKDFNEAAWLLRKN